jgi:hypothetical protein
MGELDNDPRNRSTHPSGPGPKVHKETPGVEEVAEPRDVERPVDKGTGRTKQMQNADNSRSTEETVESTGSRGQAAPEVGLPSDAERRSDEL